MVFLKKTWKITHQSCHTSFMSIQKRKHSGQKIHIFSDNPAAIKLPSTHISSGWGFERLKGRLAALYKNLYEDIRSIVLFFSVRIFPILAYTFSFHLIDFLLFLRVKGLLQFLQIPFGIHRIFAFAMHFLLIAQTKLILIHSLRVAGKYSFKLPVKR